MADNQYYTPAFSSELPQEHQIYFRQIYQSIGDINAAIKHLNTNSGTTTNVTNITQVTESSSSASSLAGLGKVNPQSSDYSLQSTDAGSLVTMTASVSTTITLNFNVGTPFFCFIENFGTSVTNLSPDNGALINGGASLALQPNFYAVVFFDNLNWEAATLPLTTLNLETNGTANSSQTLLNLVAGSNVTLSESGGAVTIAATGGGGGATKTPHDVTASRSLGSIYQNTSGVDMWVSGYCTTSGGGTAALQAVIGTVTPTSAIWADDYTATLSSGRAGFGFYVPNNYYYELNMVGGAGSAITGVGLWVEFY